jgi:hypothetical protein
MRGIENGISRVPCAKFYPVVRLQLLALNALPVYERAMLAALIDQE